MTQQKNRFLTFLFSLMPGCGHMYMGFMKRGVSLLSLFVGVIAFADFLVLEELFIIDIIVWCYAFFDALNLRSMDPAAVAAMPDSYLFSSTQAPVFTALKEQSTLRRWCGVLLLVVGFASLWSAVSWRLIDIVYLFSERMYDLLWSLNRILPRAAASIFVILVGLRLTREKKQELSEDPIEGEAIDL